ncbi:MAG: patatin-like phospholipase family protein [Nocardioidaceae bacterium]
MAPGRIAFVLGGGGVHGACEVGMLRALSEGGVHPDVILGTSVGAINGAMYAKDPGEAGVTSLGELWDQLATGDVFGSSLAAQTATLVRTRTHVQRHGPLRRLLVEQLGDIRIEELAVPFQCVAASIERAAEHWFQRGPLVDAVLASSAVPGLLPAVHIDGEHFLDGGLVASIPVDRAIALGATTVYVLQVGRVESPLRPPRQPLEVALVAFEIARRHRFATTMAGLPDHVDVHVLPTGAQPMSFSDRRQFRYRDFGSVPTRITTAYVASRDYLTNRGLDA